MTYLITQIFVFLLVAALLGMLLGWYLTRIAAASVRAGLQARIDKALAQVGELQNERDSAAAAAENNERERRLLSDEANRLRAELDAARADTRKEDDVDGLRAELEDCRQSLAALTAPATGNDQAVDSAAIASAAAAAVSGIGSLLDSGATQTVAPDETADDLQRIKGIGPKIADILQDLGIRRYAQIAAWTPDKVAWINDHLKFKGRVERERWIEQAKALIEGD
jgi:NADH-quinone oxidoreductase subunit E